MASFDSVRGRDDGGRFTRTLVDPETTFEETKHAQSTATGADGAEAAPPAYESPTPTDSQTSFDTNGVEDDVKEAERNPEHVTTQAGLGQQKAEAAALVWSRPVVFGIYAW